MIPDFRGKNLRDTETAPETIISGVGMINNLSNCSHKTSSMFNISNQLNNQHSADSNFDNFIEKRK
jgi:hypothetical protein